MQRMAIVAGIALAVLSACAPRGEVDTTPLSPDEVVAIVVEHNVPAAGSLTVRLIDPVGSWQLLGTVAPAQSQTFVVEEDPVAGRYRLVAETPDGRTASSRPFTLTGEDGVRWNLFTNNVVAIDVEFEEEIEMGGEPAIEFQ